MSRGRDSRLARRVASAALWLVVWQVASLVVGNAVLLAGPVETVVRLAQLVFDARFLSTVAFSLTRIVGGFLAAFVSAVLLALAARRWRAVEDALAPAVTALKSVPIVCIIVLLLMWVGSRSVSGIAVFLAVFPAVYFSALEGLADVSPQVGEMLRVFGVRGFRGFCAHTWPELLPFLLGTSRNVCGMAWKAGVAAELIGSPMGSIGERIYQSKILLETADLFAWTIVVVLASWACEQVFVALLARSGKASLALALRLPRGETLSCPPAEVRIVDASIGYGEKVVASGLSFVVPVGGRLLLDQESGYGKTTLLRTIAGLQPMLAGSLSAPRSVSMEFQEARLIEDMTAEQNVELVAAGGSALLREVLPADALAVPVRELSGGQRRRVELVRALAYRSGAVLLDEPFASLDEDTRRTCESFIDAHLEGRPLLVASHV